MSGETFVNAEEVPFGPGPSAPPAHSRTSSPPPRPEEPATGVASIVTAKDFAAVEEPGSEPLLGDDDYKLVDQNIRPLACVVGDVDTTAVGADVFLAAPASVVTRSSTRIAVPTSRACTV